MGMCQAVVDFLNFFGTFDFSFPLPSEVPPALLCCQQHYLV